MTILPKYLSDSAKRIRKLPDQILPTIASVYLQWDNPQMKRLYEKFPNNRIQRADLDLLYAAWSDPVLCAVATFVWGGIDTTKNKCLQQVLALKEDDLEQRLRRIRELVRRMKLKEAFLSCCEGGDNRIPGVGMAFFTKVFFFVGASDAGVTPKPLILDQWTTNAFFALRGQSKGTDDVRTLFTIPSQDRFKKDKFKSVSIKGYSEIQAKAYLEYVELMNGWAGQLNVTPDKLEQFVFGTDRRRDRSPTNPRNELVAIIERQLFQ